MNLTCGNCNLQINNRQFLNCSKCQKSLHLDCANVSAARFYIMEPERKLSWKCDNCLTKTQDIHNLDQSPLMNSNLLLSPPLPTPKPNKNITSQMACKINIPTGNSFGTLSTDDDDSDGTEDSMCSIKNTSIILNTRCQNSKKHVSEKVEDMKKIVLELREKLECAEKEIENLLAENGRLKQQMKKTDTGISTPKNTPSSRKRMSKTRIDFCQDIEDSPCKNKTTCIPPEPSAKTSTLISSPEKTHNTSNVENVRITTHKDPASNSLTSSAKLHSKHTKICIISNGSKYNTVDLAEKTFPQSPTHNNPPTICHYSSPGGGMEQLFHRLENKLTGYTHDDYCIIFIGESDFLKSEKYSAKINYIRNCVQPLEHTNIIICLPTFKQGRFFNIYNRRIEAFNKLLYTDNLKNEYAYILDSNKNLKYTDEMFNKYSGKANKRALMTIFNDIKEFVYYIGAYFTFNNNKDEVLTQETFFRP